METNFISVEIFNIYAHYIMTWKVQYWNIYTWIIFIRIEHEPISFNFFTLIVNSMWPKLKPLAHWVITLAPNRPGFI